MSGFNIIYRILITVVCFSFWIHARLAVRAPARTRTHPHSPALSVSHVFNRYANILDRVLIWAWPIPTTPSGRRDSRVDSITEITRKSSYFPIGTYGTGPIYVTPYPRAIGSVDNGSPVYNNDVNGKRRCLLHLELTSP